MLNSCVKLVESLCISFKDFKKFGILKFICGINMVYSQTYSGLLNSFFSAFSQKNKDFSDVIFSNPQNLQKLLLLLRSFNLINIYGENL
ncbi:hypothetical protein DYH10_01085 [Candidatus Saccharibacteria bacterium CPR2]|nr:hypothetical protein [Candidatus Saccharibacteria bacterium CPR2]